jgi:hypothetical protein
MSDQLGRLRLVGEDKVVTGCYSDSVGWVAKRSATTNAVDLHSGLSAWSHGSLFADQGVLVAFDNSVVTQEDLVCSPEPTHLNTHDGRSDRAPGPVTTSDAERGQRYTLREAGPPNVWLIGMWSDVRKGVRDDFPQMPSRSDQLMRKTYVVQRV